MLTFISEINNRNYWNFVNSSHNGKGDYIFFYLNKKLNVVNYFYRPQTIESSKHATKTLFNRGDRIRTCDLVLPKHPRYQAAPRPVSLNCRR